MKNFIYSAIIVIILHLIFFTNIKIDQTKQNFNKNGKKTTHTNIKYVTLSKPKIINKPKKITKNNLTKNKKINTKKVTKKLPKTKYKKYRKVIKKNKKIKKRNSKKIIKKAVKKQTKKPVSSLEYMFLSQPESKPVDKLTQSYLNLYGNEYNKFTPDQKKYLKKHLKDIGLITQRYLTYPPIAARTRQYGTNVVEFYLHPNGDITDLKLIRKLYYTSLDENSIYTIQIAYKDYPRPKVKTKIRIYINYRLR